LPHADEEVDATLVRERWRADGSAPRPGRRPPDGVGEQADDEQHRPSTLRLHDDAGRAGRGALAMAELAARSDDGQHGTAQVDDASHER